MSLRERRLQLGTALLVLMVAVTIVAAVATPAPHTGGDNAGYLSLAHSLVEGQGYVEAWDPETPPHTKYPPVFPLLLAALSIAGASTWTAFKALSAVELAAATVLAFAWAAGRGGALVGAAVALLALLSLGWLDASRWILSEPTFLAFTFLALWAADRGESPDRAAKGTPGWLALAALGTGLACMTRAAGAPLALALLVSLLLARRVTHAAIIAGALAVPGLWWVLRSAGSGGAGAYSSEFWMVNPYEPELGGVGWLDLPARAWSNLRAYVTEVLPREWWSGIEPGTAVALGVAIAVTAAVGWGLRIRDRGAGTAELFAPLYFGMILIWPEVWSGGRLMLPLYPLLLLYAGQALRVAGHRFGRVAELSFPAVGFLLLVLPAMAGALSMAEDAGACRRAVARSSDGFECNADGFREFRAAAAWSGENLPAGAVVLNRKPRTFYLIGSIQGRVFPFSRDPLVLLAEADRSRARYVLLDHVDGIGAYYLPPAITARPLAFCYLAGWGSEQGAARTDLFGILPTEDRREGGEIADIGECPASYRVDPPRDPIVEGIRIPLLARP